MENEDKADYSFFYLLEGDGREPIIVPIEKKITKE